MSLSAPLAGKLGRLIPRLASDHDGEVIAAGALANAGGSGDNFFVASTDLHGFYTFFNAYPQAPLVTSSALPAGTIVGVDLQSFVSAFGSEPRIDASQQATIHVDDSPTPLSAAGTPNTVAAPLRDALQHDLVVVRIRLDCAWALRQPGAVAVVENAVWA